MKQTINDIYELIKQKLEDRINAFANNGTPANRKEFEAYAEILGLIKESGVLEEEQIKDKALELACRHIDSLMGDEDSEYVTDPFTFILLAKEELAEKEKEIE